MTVRTFTVTSIRGHCEVTTFDSPGPESIEVVVTAENALREYVELRYPVDGHPRIGDKIRLGALP